MSATPWTVALIALGVAATGGAGVGAPTARAGTCAGHVWLRRAGTTWDATVWFVWTYGRQSRTGRYRLELTARSRPGIGRPTVLQKRMDLGPGMWLPGRFTMRAVRLTHRGRRQLFVRFRLNRQVGQVIDFDGRSLRRLYYSNGPPLLYLERSRGQVDLMEAWPVRFWNDAHFGHRSSTAGVIRERVRLTGNEDVPLPV